MTLKYLYKDVWYCCDRCQKEATSSKKLDRVNEHSKALLLDGLFHLIRYSAIREGNGPAVICDWKADLIQFFNFKHHKYVILAVQHIAG